MAKGVSDTYFVLEQFKPDEAITDFRYYSYNTLKSLKPSDVPELRDRVNAREFLRGLADIYPVLLSCQSRAQLVKGLEGVAANADMAADSGAVDARKMSLYCGVRDTTKQLIGLLR